MTENAESVALCGAADSDPTTRDVGIVEKLRAVTEGSDHA